MEKGTPENNEPEKKIEGTQHLTRPVLEETDTATMPKNIVICLDGTGNQIEENLSNVLKLYRTLHKRDTVHKQDKVHKQDNQVVYYSQGVGTLGQQYTWGATLQRIKMFFGLATGYGLDKNVLDAYRFIVEHYKENDKIYIFGFSRGAHTARVLAGFIYVMGLLHSEQVNLAGSALSIYKRSTNKKQKKIDEDDCFRQADHKKETKKSQKEIDEANRFRQADHFRRITRSHRIEIDFLGVWDTVSSIIVPRSDRFYKLPSFEKLPFTRENPAVKTFRQAMAIDERRRMFRLDDWKDGQEFKPNKYSTGVRVSQNIQQVWFAGYHADIGGAHKRCDSAIGQFPLIWIIEEAKAFGLKVNNRMLDHVARGEKYNAQSKHNYPPPDHAAALHNSMTLLWVWMELIPKRSKFKEWLRRKAFFGLYLPLSEPRLIPKDANIHQSVVDRFFAVSDYKPKNLPNLPVDYTIIP